MLRAINSAKSAFMAVTFAARFFESYAVVGAPLVQAGVLLKHALAAVRTQRARVAAFSLTADARLEVRLECDNGAAQYGRRRRVLGEGVWIGCMGPHAARAAFLHAQRRGGGDAGRQSLSTS